VIDKDDFTLQGAGHDTLIDGGTVDHAINAKGNNCTIKNLSVSGTNDNTEYNGIRITGGSGCKILQCVVRDSDGRGILIRGPDTVVDSCIVEDAGSDAIRSDSERCIIKNCVVDETSANDRFPHSITVSADMIVANCVVRVGTTTSSNKPDGIALNFTTDSIVIGNRVMNAKRRGISAQTTDVGHIIANNRISDSAESDIDNLGSGIVIEGNLTGSAN
jgi:parallel beta-helix repeat protein